MLEFLFGIAEMDKTRKIRFSFRLNFLGDSGNILNSGILIIIWTVRFKKCGYISNKMTGPRNTLSVHLNWFWCEYGQNMKKTKHLNKTDLSSR